MIEKELDIYEYINSVDMEQYLRNMNYLFTAPEAAFIVYQSEKFTLNEKMKAWQAIIDTIPDCSVEERTQCMRIDSFHLFLRKYMALKTRDVERFCSGYGSIYSYEWHEIPTDKTANRGFPFDDGWHEEFDHLFSEYHSCAAYCAKNVLNEEDIDKVKIFKRAVNSQERFQRESITFDKNMDIIDLDIHYDNDDDLELDSVFDGMCFDFPTPFKRGDILVNCRRYKNEKYKPFVLSYITTWNSKEMMNKGFKEHECPYLNGWIYFDKINERILQRGDYSDMHAIGTEIDDEIGNLYTDNLLVLPIDLTYYQETLTGSERQLQVYAAFEKNEIDAEVLTNCCCAIRMEEYVKSFHERCISIYRKETMEQIGMFPV